MKKVFGFSIFMLMAFVSQASYLYWQVDTDQFSNLKEIPTQWGVVAVDGSEYSSSSTALTSSYMGWDATQGVPALTGDATKQSGEGAYYANLTGSEGSTYTYFIELYNDSGAVVGHSEGISYSNTGSIISDLSNIGQQLTVYSGGTYAVPEPTGAMLMIFGLAMLGLKRRKV